MFFHYVGCCFVSIDSVAFLSEAFQFHEIPFIKVDLRALATGVLLRKLSPVPKSSRMFTTFSSIRFSVSFFFFNTEVFVPIGHEFCAG